MNDGLEPTGRVNVCVVPRHLGIGKRKRFCEKGGWIERINTYVPPVAGARLTIFVGQNALRISALRAPDQRPFARSSSGRPFDNGNVASRRPSWPDPLTGDTPGRQRHDTTSFDIIGPRMLNSSTPVDTRAVTPMNKGDEIGIRPSFQLALVCVRKL